jgi:hypothetical protein
VGHGLGTQVQLPGMGVKYRAEDLTPAERLRLMRKRAGVAMADNAIAFGVGEWKYSEWEHGRGDDLPWVKVTPAPLTLGECCALARRRANLGLVRLSQLTGWSRVTLIKWEKSLGDRNPLAGWWDQRGWPA